MSLVVGGNNNQQQQPNDYDYELDLIEVLMYNSHNSANLVLWSDK